MAFDIKKIWQLLPGISLQDEHELPVSEGEVPGQTKKYTVAQFKAFIWTYVSGQIANITQGPQGVQGAQGGQGFQGVKGEKGDKGDKGDQGLKGNVGAQGSIGIQGPIGAKGDKGDTGAQGVQGVQGEAGADGIQGIQGENGQIIVAGDAANILSGLVDPTTEGVDDDFYVNTTTNILFGPKASGVWPVIGITLTGPQGAQGVAGAAGEQGVQGQEGVQGIKGDTGLTGAKGDKGDQGVAGVKGDDGAGLTGGTVGQSFEKKSAIDGDADWVDIPGKIAAALNVKVPKVIALGNRAAMVRDPEGGTLNIENSYASGIKATGILRIMLPTAYSNSLLTIKGSIKRGNADEFIEFTVGGYWSGETTNNWWSIDPAKWKRSLSDNLDLPVKLGYVTLSGVVYPVIDIGQISTVWSSYLFLAIDKIYISNGFGVGVEKDFVISLVDTDTSVSNRNTAFVLEGGSGGGGGGSFASLTGNARDNVSLTSELDTITNAVNANSLKIGTLSSLITTDKSSLVAAINENRLIQNIADNDQKMLKLFKKAYFTR